MASPLFYVGDFLTDRLNKLRANVKQIPKIAAYLKKSISLKLCSLLVLSCYAVGLLKYRVIIEKCANFDDAAEAVILTLNFNPTSRQTRIGKPCIQSP